ncbi:MAG: ferrous iron transport protein A, partial [Planctomycetota bacterium]
MSDHSGGAAQPCLAQPCLAQPCLAQPCLADLQRGVEAVIGDVCGDDALAQRLRSVGLWPGVVVERLASAPFGGPLLFRLHGYRLALRREEAQRVALQ